VGGGPRQTTLEGLAAELGIAHAVRFDGRASFADVEAALGEAWALVAPSLWPEPFGLVAVEAITRGVPAIVSASGGFAETVEEGVSGYLVPNGDEQGLAECLIAAIDRGPTSVPADVVRALRRRHDVDDHATELSVLFGEVIAARHRAGGKVREGPLISH
jgi:glycosyltransferase involved in cell wall biosynthesis